MKMSAETWVQNLNEVVQKTDCHTFGESISLPKAYLQFSKMLEDVRTREGFVWWVANGGSATLASHFAQDLFNKLKIRSLPFSDASLLTCQANDYGYDKAFPRMVEGFSKSGDLLIAISSSGKSANILGSVSVARQKSIPVISLSGFEKNNPLEQLKTDLSFYLPSSLYGIVETGHGVLLHAVVETLALSS